MTEGLNWDLARSLNGLAGRYPLLDSAAVLVATDLIFLIALSVAFWWFIPPGNHDGKRAALAAIVALFCGQVFNLVLGQVLFVPRPFTAHVVQLLVSSATDSSFPSDHATAAFTIACTAFLRRMPGRWLLLAGALLVAIARVFVGAHYPTDVIAGAFLGLGWSFLFLRLDSRMVLPYAVTIGIARRLRIG